MLKEADKEAYSKKLVNKQLSYLTKKAMHTQILVKSKKNTKCPYCGAINGPVKKGPGLLKILHEPFRGKKNTDPIFTRALGKWFVDGAFFLKTFTKFNFHFLDELLAAAENNRELEQLIGPSALIQELNALQVLDLFKCIPQSDIPLLGMTASRANPADLLVTRMFVPPVCIRPSVVSEVKAGTTEDDLTMKQSEILLINDVIAKHMSTGGKMELIQEDWDFLQLHVALYFNSELSGVPLAMIVSI